MKVTVIKAERLAPDLQEIWSNIQQSDASLASPYFRPEFTAAVSAVRNDVYVAVLQDASEVVGFFPFQRNHAGVGQPVGAWLTDFHGLVAKAGVKVEAQELLRQCGMVIWDFDHLLDQQDIFCGFHRRVAESKYMDLSMGYEGYCRHRREAGSEQIKKLGTLRRKFEKEFGPLRFELHSSDSAALHTLVKWKRRQYAETGLCDIFLYAWTNRLLEQILKAQGKAFSGVLSLLYADGELAAAHFGMRSQTVWHYWFPAYDPKFAKYSPGLALLLSMAERAPMIGIERIDLGKGDDLYKQRLGSGGIAVAEGSIELPSAALMARRVYRGCKSLVEGTAVDWPLRLGLRKVRRLKAKLLRE